jgi:hypothetical protein
MKLKTNNTLSYLIFVDVPPIHLGLASPSSLVEATGENNAMDDEEQTNYIPMDEDEVSKGLPHLRESELPIDGVAQLDVHWAIRGEGARKKFHCLWVECKRNYVSKQKLKKHLINDHCFLDVEGGGKGGRPRMPGPTRTRSTTVEENRMNNLRALSNPVARLKRQDAKAKSRWAIAAERQWENMFRDAAENPLPYELPPLAMFFIRSVKTNFNFATWGDALFDPATWTAFKRSKSIRNRIARSRLPYMSTLAPAFSRERYELRESANIRELAFRELAEYNTVAHVHKKMEFFGNFEAFLEHYVKLRARLRASSSSIRALKAERAAALARETQSRASDDDIEWRAPSPENSDEANSVDDEEEEEEEVTLGN